jgi:hypothetical protein
MRPRSAILPRGYLARKGRQLRAVRLFDVAVLLLNIQKGAATPDVGFEDADRTIEEITRRLEKRVLIDPSLLESALWSCNMLSERGEFAHPEGKDIQAFVKDVLGPSSTFNFNLHLIGDKND